jgi:hypothetical protein
MIGIIFLSMLVIEVVRWIRVATAVKALPATWTVVTASGTIAPSMHSGFDEEER